MSKLLEILGRAITVDTADLILHWLNEVKPLTNNCESTQMHLLNQIIELMGDGKIEAAQEQIDALNAATLERYPPQVQSLVRGAGFRTDHRFPLSRGLNELYVREKSSP